MVDSEIVALSEDFERILIEFGEGDILKLVGMKRDGHTAYVEASLWEMRSSMFPMFEFLLKDLKNR